MELIKNELADAEVSLLEAQTGYESPLRRFGFTHYDPLLPHNAKVLHQACESGLVINLSANSLAHADRLAETGVAPVAVIVPRGTQKPLTTPAGRLVAICPAVTHDNMSCARCGICAVGTRKAIIGFPAHGAGAGKVERVIQRLTKLPTTQ